MTQRQIKIQQQTTLSQGPIIKTPMKKRTTEQETQVSSHLRVV